jgi:2-amino-4-hydroxy-6-hydroxymethyldihydropteridine diphosphokinase
MKAAGLAIEKVSSFIESQPYGLLEQPPFINAAAYAATKLSPGELLRLLQNIEDSMGRRRLVRWGERNIDLDILLYDKIILHSGDLVIPHPDMLNRWFVLAPLAEVAGGDFIHPVSGRPLSAHLVELRRMERVR